MNAIEKLDQRQLKYTGEFITLTVIFHDNYEYFQCLEQHALIDIAFYLLNRDA